MNKTVESNKMNCKELLIQRMFFAIGSSIIVHFVLMSGVVLVTNLKIMHPLEWIQDTWNVVTCFRMWTYFFFFSIVVFLQGIICSKDYMNPVSYASSRFVKFCHIFTPHNLLVGGLYTLLGGILAWLHLSVEGGRFGSLIKSCDKSEGYCLVEEHYFLLLEGFWIGLYFFINSSYIRSRNLEFPVIPQTKLSQVKRGIQTTLVNTFLDALWPMIYFLGFYAVFGSYCRDIFSVPFSLSIDEMPLDKISRLLSLSLMFYSWLHAVLFILIIQSKHLFFQAYLTEWIAFDIDKSLVTEQSKITLIDALAMEKIPIICQLGYLDLVNLSQKDKTRRSIIFTLSQPGGHPYNWNSVVEKSLSLIKKFAEGLNSVCSTQKEQQAPQVAKAVPSLSTRVPENPYTYHMRSLVSPKAKEPLPVNDNNDCEPAQVDNFVIQYFKNARKNFINYLLSKRLISYIFAEQIENKLRHVLVDGQAVIWAADSISLLASLSLTEDPYGIVQKDLTEIIETLLSLKQSMDKLQKLNISIRKPMSDDRFLKQTLTALRSAVRRSLYRIAMHFRDYIDDLVLSSTTVDQLQPFFTFKE